MIPAYKKIPLNKERFLFIVNNVFLGIQLIKYLVDNFEPVNPPANKAERLDHIQICIKFHFPFSITSSKYIYEICKRIKTNKEIEIIYFN